jgi:hypothetical protein
VTTTNTHTLWIEEANSFIWKIDLIYFPFIVRICVDLEKLLNVGRIVGTGNILFFYRMLDMFCTFTETGGCSTAEQLEGVLTARLSSSSSSTVAKR